jgi:hypothetical protein
MWPVTRSAERNGLCFYNADDIVFPETNAVKLETWIFIPLGTDVFVCVYCFVCG